MDMNDGASPSRTFPSPPWSSRMVWIGLVTSLALIFGSSILWVIFAPESLASDIAAIITVGETIAIPVAWFFGPRRYGGGWRMLGFRKAGGHQFLLGCGLLAIMFIFNYVYSLILLLFDTSIQPELQMIVTDTDFPLWLVGATVLIGPFSEEILFRGFMFGGFESRYGWKKAALFSSLIFAFLHLQPTAFLPLTVIGFLLCYLYYSTNSLWPGLVIHALMNAGALLGAFLLNHLQNFQ
jgi:membrane protease YdiL (CAAX protease family)